jgi:hypothetical protein
MGYLSKSSPCRLHDLSILQGSPRRGPGRVTARKLLDAGSNREGRKYGLANGRCTDAELLRLVWHLQKFPTNPRNCFVAYVRVASAAQLLAIGSLLHDASQPVHRTMSLGAFYGLFCPILIEDGVIKDCVKVAFILLPDIVRRLKILC